MKSSLRTKILLPVGVIILLLLGTSTLIYIQNLKRNYLEAIEWRSEALAQGMLEAVPFIKTVKPTADFQEILRALSIQCSQLYEANQAKNIAHVAVISPALIIAAHNDSSFWDTPIQSPILLEQLKLRKLTTILDGLTYHTLFPIVGTLDTYIGTIDIGVSKKMVDAKVREILLQSAALLGLFLLVAGVTVSGFMYVLLTKPVKRLMTAGQQLAEGNLSETFPIAGRSDEIAVLGAAFNSIGSYLRNIAAVAARIATGVLAGEVQVRSAHDVLGNAVHEMLAYLKHVAAIVARITEGDLTETVRLRSNDDAFGQMIQAMMTGLRELIAQIRNSAEQIAATGTMISALAGREISMVHEVDASVAQVLAAMTEIGASAEEVAHDMETLSASVEETSASVSQMTAAITHIVLHVRELTQQTQQTIVFLDDAGSALQEIVKSTDNSKRLSEETIQNALDGQQSVEQVMVSMATIQQTITTAVAAITTFAQRSQEIDTILDVIREITEQTSLLALNASIIAAQAGAHGRGFAVVADEIKTLATGVATSTKNIAAIVQSLQQDINRVVEPIHAGATSVQQGMTRTQQAQAALQKIMASARQSSAVVTEIASALHELLTTSQETSTAMARVNAMTEDITTATKEQEASTKQIHQAIAHINNLAAHIQQATAEQSSGVRQVLDATNTITRRIDQNLDSSRQIVHTTEELSAQAGILVQSVDRFKLNT